MPRRIANGLDLLGTRINNVGDASLPADAVNLRQLQSQQAGLNWKAPAARAASTANVSLAAPGASIDGVTLAVGDRVLLKNQTDGTQNGLYVWAGAATALTRTTDASTAAGLQSAATFVSEGTVNKDTGWTQNSDSIVVGTTALVWAQFGGMTVYTGVNGVNVTGTTLSAVAAPGGGATVTSSGIAVDTSKVVGKYAANIGDGTSTTIMVTHALATTDVTYSLRLTATGEVFEADVVVTGANALTVTTATPLASGAARVVVHG